MLRRLMLILPIALLLFSCRKHSNPIREDLPYTVVSEKVEIDSLYASLTDQYNTWSDLYAPVTIALQAPAEMSMSGRATMLRDSIIYISLRAMGMEVGQLYIANDSLIAVDKYHKIYVAEDMRQWLGGYPLTIGNLQDLLLGRAFLPGDGTLARVHRDMFMVLRNGDMWSLMPLESEAPIKWYYTAWATDPAVLAALILGVPGKSEVVCEYANPAETEAGMVDKLVTVQTDINNAPLYLSVQWDIDGAKWNTGRAVSFTPPSPQKYRRLDGAALLQSLSVN